MKRLPSERSHVRPPLVPKILAPSQSRLRKNKPSTVGPQRDRFDPCRAKHDNETDPQGTDFDFNRKLGHDFAESSFWATPGLGEAKQIPNTAV